MKQLLLLVFVIVFVCKTMSSRAQVASLDSSFGVDGKVTSKISSTGYNYGTCIATQKDGKIIVGGYSWLKGYEFTLVRYLPNGSIDSTFGTDGKKISTYFNNQTFGYSLKIQDDGRILLAGNSYDGFGNYSFAMARFGPDGQTDYSFGNLGIAVTPYPNDNYANNGYAVSVAIQNDGKYLLGGHLSHASSVYFGLLRYNTDGQTDSSFGQAGWVITKFNTIYDTLDYGTTVLVQPDDKIVLTGYAGVGELSQYNFALARYNENGVLDSTFGINGQVTTTYQTGQAYAYSSLIQPDNKIVLAGAVYDYSTSTGDFALARYLANGHLDSSFGKNGFEVTPLDNSTSSIINGITLQLDGKILACGQASGNFALVRYNSNGTFDSSFGVHGQVYTDFGTDYDVARALAQQSDGKILVAGDDQGNNIEIARYNNDQTTLPVFLLSFTAYSLDNSHTRLNWTTPPNSKDKNFIVQRSTDGIHFLNINTINSSLSGIYSYDDDFSTLGYTSDFVYYRLLMIDAEGTSSYSQIEKVNITMKFQVVLSPNPVKTSVNLLITVSQNEKATIRMTDAAGKIVYTDNKYLLKGTANYSINISTLSKGIYYVQVITQNNVSKVNLMKY